MPIFFGFNFKISSEIYFFLFLFDLFIEEIIDWGIVLKSVKSCLESFGRQYPPNPKLGLL